MRKYWLIFILSVVSLSLNARDIACDRTVQDSIKNEIHMIVGCKPGVILDSHTNDLIYNLEGDSVNSLYLFKIDLPIGYYYFVSSTLDNVAYFTVGSLDTYVGPLYENTTFRIMFRTPTHF